MNGLYEHFQMSLRLHFRNRMSLLYGYLFPLIFLLAFWVLYRNEEIPLLDHMGAVLTISILGGACFGLPTTLVSEREAGTWRRLRALPAPTWTLVASTALARYLLLASAGVTQLILAVCLGMPGPEHPLGLFVAFTVASFAFIGIGLIIAMLADTVPAVQALGQCVFLPMLIIGGVAVQMASLPVWAQKVSAFFPGRYAVDALQRTMVKGDLGTGDARFDLLALVLIGVLGVWAGSNLFRWDVHQSRLERANRLGLVLAVSGWLMLGWAGVEHRRVFDRDDMATEFATSHAPESWEAVRPRDVASLDFNVPADFGRITPIAAEDELPGPELQVVLDRVEAKLADWPPGHAKDDLESVRNLVTVASIADLGISSSEKHLPRILLAHLSSRYPKEKLVRMLTWIALHPEEGKLIDDLSPLGLEVAVGSPEVLRDRNHIYAIKLVMRLTGRAKLRMLHPAKAP